MYNKKYRIHFVGIGGIGMSGIAELLLRLGYRVTGSDIRSSDITRRLEGLGCVVYEGHAAGQAAGADIVVVSNAIDGDNPEVLSAGEESIPVIPRAEMLAELMRFKYGVAISGAHGKTSTTSIVASILGEGGLDPTVVIGGKLKSVGNNAVLGQGDFIVAEADESDGSFLRMSPSIAVVTNIDREHLDFYKDLDEIKDSFARFIDGMPFYGLAVLCVDNPHVRELIPGIKKRFITYGTSPGADLEVKDILFEGLETVFQVVCSGEKLGEIRLNLPGLHNARNAAAGIAVGLELGVSFDKIRSALECHKGVERRLEIKGETRGILVVDDYGHHPTEIETTLGALEKSFPGRRVAALFQPHRHTRTQALFDEFSRVFHRAGVVYLLPVYAAGETAIPGSDSRRLAAAIEKASGVPAFYVKDFDAAALRLEKELGSGDILLTLGAGDVWKAGERFVNDDQ
jgi:UDP-N-acetylmuramate--alanine ligase